MIDGVWHLRQTAGRNVLNATGRFSSPAKGLSTTSSLADKHRLELKVSDSGGKEKGKDSIKITLLGKGNDVSVTTLEEAQKLSRRRNMKLVKVEDEDRREKTQRPVYKLLTTAEILSEDVAGKSANHSKKQEKFLNIGSRIEEHDLTSRIKNIIKWLQKGNEVRILIHGTNESDPGIGKVNNAIESAVKEIGGRCVHRVNKGGSMKFSILPPSTAA